MNPYPTRLGVDTRPVTLPLPTLPDEPRLDLTHLPALAIDDEGSLDPDDALSLEALPHGWRLWVHVSDAAALITPDSELDLEARRRGATLYLPEGAVPMLPQAAIEALGLGLGEVSPALSIRVDLDANFEPLEVDVALTRVRVTRLTYAQAQEQLGDEPLATLRRIAAHLREGRAGRGALMIELPEVKVRVHGGQVDVKVLPPLESRQVVQESMMLAGWAVATFGLEHGIPLPYAAQEAFERYDDQATTLPEMYARRRSLKRTQWAAQPAPHAGLGLERYVQSTSPMRRYLDLVAHQQLRAFLAERPFVRTPDMLQRIGAADLASSGVREAERKSLRHWTLVYLSRHRGPWHGVVVDRRGPAATVLLTELALELSLTGDLAPGSELRLEAAEIDLPGLDARVRNVG
nr:RNB domain-containing ribonuclease [Deinobacterium chartae]